MTSSVIYFEFSIEVVDLLIKEEDWTDNRFPLDARILYGMLALHL